MIYGDKNTKYFHAKAVTKKRKTSIAKLKDDDVRWVEDDTSLKQMMVDYFKKLFSKESFSSFPIYNSFSKLEQDVLNEIERSVSYEEIKMVVFSMNPLKASRPDGLNALFF